MKTRLLLLSLSIALPTLADDRFDVRRYDESSGLSQAHATQIVQHPDGMLWLATWNGLNRFDGYEFRRMTSQAGDGCSMASDRLRDIWLSDNGDLYCQVDDGIYRFDTRTYRFHDLAGDAELQHARQQRRRKEACGRFNGQFIAFTDRQGLQWELRRDAVYCRRPVRQPAQLLPQARPAETRCLYRDRQGRIWVTTKDDATVRLFTPALQPLGYLTAKGTLQTGYATFGTPVYCMQETRDGSLWLGSKPGGLFRWREGQGLEHIGGLPCNDIYDIVEDAYGRLWLATLGGGVVCWQDGRCRQFLDGLRVRFLHLTADGILLAATTEGLAVARVEPKAENMRFHRHLKEPDRPTSLGCNATMDILQTPQGRLFVSTESGGVCEILSTDLLADTLSFRRLDMQGGWPTDVALSMVLHGQSLLLTSNSQLTDYRLDTRTGSTFDAWFFNHPYRFSEVHPLLLDDDRWLLATQEGAVVLPRRDMQRDAYVPAIALTGIAIQNGTSQLAVNALDTLHLAPTERSLTIHFAALDYTGPERISYAFRLGDTPWNLIGHDHSVTLLDLKPGTYELWLRSTNADGAWGDNQRRLVIVVQPRFVETVWFRLLLALLTLAFVAALARTILYIRRIKRQRQETLEKYLALLQPAIDAPAEAQPESEPASEPASGPLAEPRQAPQTDAQKQADDAFMRRVMAFTEQHLADADVKIGDMADACAVSRSGLQRKMKQLLGVTPLDFLREARIKRACQLLQQTGQSVSEVAFACGFNDPKYFSRCFRQSTGKSPSEFKGGDGGAA